MRMRLFIGTSSHSTVCDIVTFYGIAKVILL